MYSISTNWLSSTCDISSLQNANIYIYIYTYIYIYIAKNIRGFNINTWNRAKVGLMTDMLHCKFDHHPNLAKKLCETGNLYIGEAIQKDTFYGIGFSLTHKEATDRKKWKTNKLYVI